MNDKQKKKIVNFLNAKPQDKIHRYKRRKVKKVWVYAAIITTMIGLESISSNVNTLSGLSSITVHADTVVNYKQQYYPPILRVESGSTEQTDGSNSYLNLLYEINGKKATDVDYIEFQLNNGTNSTKSNPKAKITGGINILGQPTVMLRVDFSGREAFDNERAFVDGNTVIHFIDGTSLVINPNRNIIFLFSKQDVESNRRGIMRLSNFTEEEKNKTFEKSISIVEKGYIDDMKSLSEVTDFDSLSDVNSLYKKTIEAKLEQASEDFTNQDSGFKQFEDEAKSKRAEINAVTDAKKGAKEKALKEVDSLLSQYRKSTFDATGKDVLSQITEGVAKIKAVSVEREKPFDKDAHKPTVNQPTEGEQVVSGKGVGGDELTIKDKDNKVIGKGTVAEDGTFTVKTDRPLEKGEELTVIPTTDGKEGTPGTTTVAEKPFDKDAHKPTVNQPTEGEQVVSGKGVGGDELTIKDKDNKVIGKGTVAEDGTFTVKTDRPLEKGEELTVIPTTDGKEGTPGTTTVAEKPFDKDAHKPTVNQPTEGEQVVSGKGVGGDELTIKDKDNKVIGKGTVAEDGTFTVKTDRPLEKGEELTVIPTTDGKEGTPGTTTVAEKPFDKDAHKPTVNQPTEGDQKVSGKGVGGDELTIKDKDNKVIGKGTVAEDGTFTVKTDRPLEKGEELTVTPTTDGKEGTPGTTTVAEKPFDKDAHKPTVNQPTEGEQVVSGKGVGGDELTIKDKDNKVIGKGTVAEDGTFTVKTDRPLEKGEELTVIPTTDGKEGTPGTTTVAEKPFDKDAHKPTVNQPTEGDQKVSGKGVGGDELTIKDKDNKVIGKGTVAEDGTFTVKTDRPLEKGEELTVIPTTDGKEGTPGTTTVAEKPFDKDAHKPTVNQPIEGEQKVSGKGVGGDELTIKDKDNKVIGKGTVAEDGTFTVKTDRPLEKGEELTVIPTTDGKEGTPGTTTVAEKPFDKDAHKPTVNQPIEGEQVVSGKGVGGDELTIKDKDNKVIGKGTVAEDGTFTVKTDRPLEKGEELTVTPTTDGKEGTPGTTTVAEKPFDKDAHKPTVNQPTEGEQVVSGKGVGGDELTIKDKDNKVIGKGTVAEDGTFTVKTDRPLEKGEELTVTPTTDGKEGTPGTTTVAEKPFDKDAHKPTVNQPTEGDQKVSGKGVGGDELTIKDKDNKVIGKGTVAEDGTFTVKTDRPLEKGEELTVIPTTDGKEGTPGTTTVAEKPFDKDAHKPTVNQPTEGEQVVSGKGVGGDELTIKDKDNKVIGKGTVAEDGTFTVKTDRPLEKGEELTVIPTTDGKEGTPGTTTVAEKPFDKDAHKPTVNQPTEGDQKVSGKGVGGDELTIKDKDNKVIGKGTVAEDGTFTVKTDRPLEKGEELTVIPTTDGKEGTPGTTTVAEKPFDKDAHKPTVNQPIEGEQKVSGKGVGGDKITIKDKDNKVIGKGTVGKQKLPSTGEYDNKSLLSTGLLLLTLAGGLLGWKLKRNK